ncbi:hypothetical protein N7454_010359 [Penicillium verhagenii]|nr:hypothetical protein N7454_010359 [Penicillium verhagenii]
MSFFSFNDIPTIKTRKALLLLDFQNDFVRPSGALHTPNTAEILESLPPLAAAFRKVGDVIWSIADWDFGDRIVLAKEPPKKHALPKSEVIEVGSDRDSPEPVDAEAFLSSQSPICCAAQTAGFQFPAPVLAAINPAHDTVLDKTGYSALESNDLVLSFRTRFVTEVYLCGSLSNVSVYATALDAVRNGFSVTLIEDCLGFRDFGRHREAMRRMADILGATGLTAEELCQELDWEETDAIARGTPQTKRPAGASLGLESVLDTLMVEADGPEDSREEDPEETLSLAGIASLTRLHRSAAGAGRHPAEGKKQVRSRVRRTKRPPPPDALEGASDAIKRPSTNSARKIDEPAIGEGDSRVVPELDIPGDAFERIRSEVSWQKMYHLSGQVPRLVAVQGQIEPNSAIPIYRHPADESPPLKPFTSAVDEVRIVVEQTLGHPLNHCLIQLYRDGQDHISEHSDKTLDIVRGSSICNVSLGAQRVMVLRTKTSSEQKDETESGRTTQRVTLPHRSLFILGQKTNMRWLHGIRPDKRSESAKSTEERAYGGERISLTFRQIGTYLHPTAGLIWGQGAVAKSEDQARPAVHGNPEETERMIRAFSQENRLSEFDWRGVYGGGFDVVNFVTASPAKLTLCADSMANLRVCLGLRENGLRYEIKTKPEMEPNESSSGIPTYVDSQGTTVTGDLAILRHLGSRPTESSRPGVDILRGGSHLAWIEDLQLEWREHYASKPMEGFTGGLRHWERALEGQHYLGGAVFGIDDCGLWPILWEIVHTQGSLDARFANLTQYYYRVEKRGIVRSILESR